MERYRRYFLLSAMYKKLPLFIESVGWNFHQKKFSRDEGYPYYHWLQTVHGKGRFAFSGGEPFELGRNEGILLQPNLSHWYKAITPQWSTFYITFGGTQVQPLMESLDLNHSGIYRWDPSSSLSLFVDTIIQDIEHKPDYTELDASLALYAFFMQLKKHGRMTNVPSFSKVEEKLRPLIKWLHHHYADPDISLDQMAEIVQISPQRLNSLFHARFGSSPYAYLIQLRIRKAKEILTQDETITIAETAKRVGFRAASHFVATFRKSESMTPAKFREMYDEST